MMNILSMMQISISGFILEMIAASGLNICPFRFTHCALYNMIIMLSKHWWLTYSYTIFSVIDSLIPVTSEEETCFTVQMNNML